MNRKMYETFCRTFQSVFKVAMNVLDWSEPKLIKGEGAVKELPKTIKQLGYNNVLVVTDKGLMGLHLLDAMFEELKNNEIAYVVYDGVQPNPTIDNIEEAKNLYLGNGCQAIIAFGGGSPMDCAKACGARIARPNTEIPKMRGVLKVLKKIPNSGIGLNTVIYYVCDVVVLKLLEQ